MKMESRGFIKMLRDCNVLNKRFNEAAADIIFTKVKDRGERFIDIHDFALALHFVAEEKGTTYEELVAQICEVEGASRAAARTASTTGFTTTSPRFPVSTRLSLG